MKTAKKQLLYSIVILIMVSQSYNRLYAQHFDFGYEYGISSYYGDLAPFSGIPSTSKSATSKGYYLGYGNHLGTVFLNYTIAELFASDNNANDPERFNRNLSFRTPIFEYGITTEINIAGIFMKRYSRIQPLLITGFSVFHFNPYTVYNGQKINLQPLGTEGQGTDAFPDREKYSLTEINIPIGAGFKIEVNDKIWFGAGAKLRLTFTDYLDDVSTTYVDPELLAAQNGTLAADLAYRGDEIGHPASQLAGSLRGNSAENDWYMTTYFTIGLRFREDRVIRKRRSRTKRKRGINCPNF